MMMDNHVAWIHIKEVTDVLMCNTDNSSSWRVYNSNTVMKRLVSSERSVKCENCIVVYIPAAESANECSNFECE